eukprot:Nitzschia sp. Nitz4//scaffold6_size259037//122828//123923//NITZ4_001074-RA/size259037-augustus-gene-0.292-mRNA-1//1//CDS//3329556893//7972//frame0
MSVILATSGQDKLIRFWNAPSGQCTRMLEFPDGPVNKIEISPDKQFLAAGGNPCIRLYDIENTEQHEAALTLEGHGASITSIGFQRHGQFLFSGSEDGTVKLWDLRGSTCARSFAVKAPVRSVALRVDKAEIISGDANGFVKVWDLGGAGVETSPDGTTNRPTGLLYEMRPPERTMQSAIQAVDISQDGSKLVAVSNHGTAYVWNPLKSQGGSPENKFRAHSAAGSYCLHAVLSPDGRHLCTTGSDGTAKLWDTTTWDLALDLKGHTKWVWDAAFCADSGYLVTASSDTTARLWNLRTGQVVRQYHVSSPHGNHGNQYRNALTCVALNDGV